MQIDKEMKSAFWMAEHFDELGPFGQQFATDLLFKRLTMPEAVRHFLDSISSLKSLDGFTNFEQNVWNEIQAAHDKWTEHSLN